MNSAASRPAWPDPAMAAARPAADRRWRGEGVAVGSTESGRFQPALPPGTGFALGMAARPGRHALLALSPITAAPIEIHRSGPAYLVVVEIARWRLADALGSPAGLAAFVDRRDPKLEALIRALADAVGLDRHRDSIVEALSTALCRSLAIGDGACAARPGDAWLNPNALRRAITMIEDRLDEDLKVDQLAAVSGLGPSAFLRAFRGSLGATPGEYLVERRMARAELLLKRTTLPIATIAAACGFGTAAHFSTTFKGRRGLQPRVLRRHVDTAAPRVRMNRA